MKHVAYNFELACFVFIGVHAAVAVVVGVKLFFNAAASDVILISFNDELEPAPKLFRQSFVVFKSSLFPSGIVPNRFGIALKLATVFISNGIGIDRFCGTNGILFK